MFQSIHRPKVFWYFLKFLVQKSSTFPPCKNALKTPSYYSTERRSSPLCSFCPECWLARKLDTKKHKFRQSYSGNIKHKQFLVSFLPFHVFNNLVPNREAHNRSWNKISNNFTNLRTREYFRIWGWKFREMQYNQLSVLFGISSLLGLGIHNPLLQTNVAKVDCLK